MKKSDNALKLATTSSRLTTFKADFVSADQVIVSYNCIPGNQPATYGNYLAIWQNSGPVPYNTEPMKTIQIERNTPDGSQVFDGLNLENNNYVIGYAVGPLLNQGQKAGNVCSTVFLPNANKDEQVDLAANLSLEFVGVNVVAFKYRLPDGCQPKSNGAWAGIWRSSQASYNNPPLDKIAVPIDNESGSISFSNVSIGIGLTYTIGFFMSGWNDGNSPDQKPMACSLTFTNA